MQEAKTEPTTRWLDEFHRAYLETALWSGNDESTPSGGEPIDDNFGVEDIEPASMVSTRKDCEDFLTANLDDLQEYVKQMGNSPDFTAWGRAGHDFWLTRNGHGAGFWDRGLGDLGERLANAAKVYREVYLHVSFENPKAVYFE